MRSHAALVASWLVGLTSLGVAGTTLYLYRAQSEEIAALRAEQAEDRSTPVVAAPSPLGSQVGSQAGSPLTPRPAPMPAADLDPGEATMADIVGRVMPAVVNITTAGRRGEGAGSGVVIDAEGLVVTNAHVVAGAARMVVHLSDGRALPADLVGADPQTDVALLRVRGEDLGLTPLAYGDSSRMRLGDVVLAIGNPFGVGQTVTMGIVSATGRAEMRIAEYEDFIQTDAAINPGNSGGALVSMSGELIGINAAILSRTGGSQGIGFAIPSNMVRPIVESLLRHGKVIRGWLGVTIQDLTPELAAAMQMSTARGVIVTGIEPGSPAEGAGIVRGDRIEELEGERLMSTAQLRTLVATRGADANVRMVVVRGDERRELQVQLAERPQAPIVAPPPQSAPDPRPVDPRFGPIPPGVMPGIPGLNAIPDEPPPPPSGLRATDVGGLAVVDLDARVRAMLRLPPDLRRGAVVVGARPGTPGEAVGLQTGDVIVEVNRVPVSGVAQLASEYARAGGNAVLLVRRGPGTLYVLMR